MHKELPLRFIPLILIFCSLNNAAWAQDVFAPDSLPINVRATPTDVGVTIDGNLTEPVWQKAETVSGFVQVEPNQGDSATFDTQVKILFDDKYLYIGAVCMDERGKSGVRVPNLQRDFSFSSNDVFGVSIDPFLDRRNAMIFQTNPYGVQRDLLSFDDNFYDNEWDGLWKVRTRITDKGWEVEMAIPWTTLRYPKKNLQDWGINFVRQVRRINQLSAWSPYPRAFTPYRMPYAGNVKGLNPPPPATNIRFQPYLLVSSNKNEVGDSTALDEVETKIGGEIKWALTPSTVLDMTFNTDFAQADVDRQVNNLSRFSIFFPERRQFFLENASVFSSGLPGTIQPFFSRKIGLDDAGNPIPIVAGARVINRTAKKAIGGLIVQQREKEGSPKATFGVVRYSKNIGQQNRIGALVTTRFNATMDTIASTNNTVGSVDGFFRISDPLSFNFMASGSKTNGKSGDGMSAYISFDYSTNWIYAFYAQSIITKNFNPEVGFVYDTDVINTNPGFYLNYRPKWKPKSIRAFEPGVIANVYHRSSDKTFQQSEVSIFPLWITFQNNAVFDVSITPTKQRLDFPFRPLGLTISSGEYTYTRYKVSYKSDQSKKLAFSTSYTTGGYFNGELEQLRSSIRVSPIPHIFLSCTYERNSLMDVGQKKENKVVHLTRPQVRLAINPRLQLMGFYQANTASDESNWNVRLSWEFQPLSFLYVVFNNNSFDRGDIRYSDQQVIGKLTYLKQF